MKRLLLAAMVTGGLVLAGSTGWADSKDGPHRWTRTVKKHSEVIYKVTYVADKNPNKQYAEFAVIGDGGTDIDLYVFDADGKEVAADTKPSDLAFARWVPAKTQEYAIKVRNLGNADNTCTMGHN
jgi:hypothetical protein